MPLYADYYQIYISGFGLSTVKDLTGYFFAIPSPAKGTSHIAHLKQDAQLHSSTPLLPWLFPSQLLTTASFPLLLPKDWGSSLAPLFLSLPTSKQSANPSNYIQRSPTTYHLHCSFLDYYINFLIDLSTSTLTALKSIFSTLIRIILSKKGCPDHITLTQSSPMTHLLIHSKIQSPARSETSCRIWPCPIPSFLTPSPNLLSL